MGRVVLVTGVSRDIGGWFARRISRHPDVERVVGVDVTAPRHDLGDVHFVEADIRRPVMAEVLAAEDVDTVVHLSVITTPDGEGGRALMKEVNVIGTMQLLAACQAAAGVERLVVKSSSHVYGASARDPSMFTEEMTPRRPPRSGFAKDSVEVEGYVRGFMRRRPDVAVTLLRCASLIGPTIRTSLTRYFTLPVVPTVLGFDARLQFCHQDDALAALEHAALGGAAGTYNVAGDGVLLLSQAIRRAGRLELPLPRAALTLAGASIPQLHGVELSSDQVSFLTYGRGIDTARMRSELGFTPRYSTAAAFDAFVGRLDPGALDVDRVLTWEAHARSAVAEAVARAVR